MSKIIVNNISTVTFSVFIIKSTLSCSTRSRILNYDYIKFKIVKKNLLLEDLIVFDISRLPRVLTIVLNRFATLSPVFADTSVNINSNSFAHASPSSFDTYLKYFKL